MGTKQKCECNLKGRLIPGMEEEYDAITELPFVKHEPGECKCTNDIQEYTRGGKKIHLCSCCC